MATFDDDDSGFVPDPIPPGVPLVSVGGWYSFVHTFRMDTGQCVASCPIGTRGCWGYDLARCTVRNMSALAVGCDKVRFVDLADPEKPIREAELTGHSQPVHSVLPLPESVAEGRLATASRDRSVRVWNISESLTERNWLVSGSWDDTIRLWDVATGKPVPDGCIEKHYRDIHVVTISSTSGGVGRSVFSGSSDMMILMHDVERDSLRTVRTFKCREKCRSLLLHPNRSHLIFSGHSNGSITIWDIRKEDECVLEDTLHSDVITRIVHVGENRFASASNDSSVKIWTDDLREALGVDEDGEKAWPITTEGWNYGLCCIEPFREAYDREASDDLLRFLLGALEDDQHVLFSNRASLFSDLEVVGMAGIPIRVFRFVL